MKKEKTGYPSIDKPWLQYYDEGAYEKALDAPKDKTIWEVYKPIIESYEGQPIINYFNNSFSGEEYLALIEKWARTFKAMGISPDEMVPVYGTWSPDIAAMFFALNAIGAHPYFQKLDITPEALEKETAGAKVAVVHETLWGSVQEVFKQQRFSNIIVSSLDDNTRFPLREILFLKSRIDSRKEGSTIPKDKRFIRADEAREIGRDFSGSYEEPFKKGRLASITSSSGTSSAVVKGIMDTNESILANIYGAKYGKPNYVPGHKVLTSTPPTASTALNCLFLLPIFYKMTSVIDPQISEETFYKQIMNYKPSITIMTGAYLETLFRKIEEDLKKGKKIDLSFADYFTIGGSGTTPDKLEKMNQIMKKCGAPTELFIGYGSSELFGVVSVDKLGVTNPNKDKFDVTDVGIPLPGFNVGIFDENGNELPYNTKGELRITGPSLTEGYYNKPELNEKAFVNGWFVTGDICSIDENGFIYYYGRKKDTIEICNQKAYLFDIANALRKEFDLQDCFVEKKQLRTGEYSVVVYFVQKPEKELIDNKTLCQSMDDFTSKNGLNIDGYIEYNISIPTSPTTIKPVTRVMEGFVKYDGDTCYDVSYSTTSEDDILDIHKTKRDKEFVLVRKKSE